MPLMLLSNPGLHLALLGNPRRRKKKGRGKFGFPSRKRYTQARWRARSRVGKRFRIKGGGRYRVMGVSRKMKRGSRRKIHRAGISWSGRKGGIRYYGAVKRRGARKYRRAVWTNPRKRKSQRKNPMKVVSSYIKALKGAPREIASTFKGPKKIKHTLFAAGGAIGTYMLGGVFTSQVLVPALGKLGAANFMSNPTASRIVGGLVPFSLGYAMSKFIKGDVGKALAVGGAVASLVEIVAPGYVGKLLAGTPVVQQVAAAAPAAATTGPVNGMAGLAGYVDSPAYQGVGGYVDSPAYQGVGEAEELAGYVDSPAYQGVGEDADGGDDDTMAGVEGYIEDGSKYMESYLN
jgi:hypothetical protein